jgi:SH3 domain-containing YSC84-like protein 1
VGRTASAETDAKMRAEILSWSRSRGVFAGLALQGATLRPDTEDNEALYGRRMESREIVNSQVAAPADAAKLMALLNKYSPREKRS